MAATEKLEFYKEDKGVEKIVKEKKILTMTNEELAKEIANVVSRKSEYKQIVAWWNPIEKQRKPPGWNCTFRTCIVPLGDTTDSRTVNHPETPACLSFEYRDKGYWVMRVEKTIDEEWDEMIDEIRKMMRGTLEVKKNKKQEPRIGKNRPMTKPIFLSWLSRCRRSSLLSDEVVVLWGKSIFKKQGLFDPSMSVFWKMKEVIYD